MSERIWWKVRPSDIEMTDERARALLTFKVAPANEAEEIFFDENASTIIPPIEKSIGGHNWDPNVEMPVPYKD